MLEEHRLRLEEMKRAEQQTQAKPPEDGKG